MHIIVFGLLFCSACLTPLPALSTALPEVGGGETPRVPELTKPAWVYVSPFKYQLPLTAPSADEMKVRLAGAGFKTSACDLELAAPLSLETRYVMTVRCVSRQCEKVKAIRTYESPFLLDTETEAVAAAWKTSAALATMGWLVLDAGPLPGAFGYRYGVVYADPKGSGSSLVNIEIYSSISFKSKAKAMDALSSMVSKLRLLKRESWSSGGDGEVYMSQLIPAYAVYDMGIKRSLFGGYTPVAITDFRNSISEDIDADNCETVKTSQWQTAADNVKNAISENKGRYVVSPY